MSENTSTSERLFGLEPSESAFIISKLSLGLSPTKSLPTTVSSDPSSAIAPRSVLVIVPDTQLSETLLDDLRFFLGRQGSSLNELPHVCAFSGWEVLPFDTLSPASSVSAERLHTLFRLACGLPTVVVTTVDALMQRVVNPSQLLAAACRLEVGQEVDRDRIVVILDGGGYTRSTLVEEYGQMAVRGAVVDFFPPGSRYPIRLELFGEELESIRTFDPASQRSVESLSAFEVIPVREVFFGAGGAISDHREGPENLSQHEQLFLKLRERASELLIPQAVVKPIEDALKTGGSWPGLEHLQPLFFSNLSSLFEYLPEQAPLVVVDEQATQQAAIDFGQLIVERAKRAKEEGQLFPDPKEAFMNAEDVAQQLQKSATHYFSRVRTLEDQEFEDEDQQEVDLPERQPDLKAEGIGVVNNNRLLTALQAARHQERPFKALAQEVRKRKENGYAVGIVVSHAHRLKRMESMLEGYELSSFAFPGGFLDWQEAAAKQRGRLPVALLPGRVSSGFRSTKERFSLIADSELFPEITRHRPAKSAASVRRLIGSVLQLKENDFVVHVEYGIGLYRGLKVLTVDDKAGDFLELEYAEGAKLFVPVENMGKVQKYSGAHGKQPSLSKLGGKLWEKTKKKVRENVAELAGQLLTVMAEREVAAGHSFGPVDDEDRDFAAAFPYEETPDQSAAIEAVLADLAKETPMDRLVCGDVGYGKTEVALRAAFKVANSGRQAAVLVPTTVLAEQHYSTFRERFADTPVQVGCISRFYSSEQNKRTLAGVADGSLDIVVGTHRLLQKDVNFRDLGLLIIDEEHRFGVGHKEKLKRYRATIDVLTLTATPIPRTLHMSLSGIRNLSLIETAPTNRQAIRTYLANYEDSIVREAVLRELGRDGQVFYIYNRVQDIAEIAAEVRALVPEARVEFAHGQMKDRQLEEVMHRFINREIDVLVSTTIVESGLDIANANTMIVRNADKFGLAELYQLRGRIGRSSRRAYAYLLIRDRKKLGADAKKRLDVLQSLDDLGVGFRLALQDMEIRGAGNLLGKDQSGHIALIGYELYSRILKDAVDELRSRKLREQGRGKPEIPQVDPDMHIGFPAHLPPDYVPDVAERLLLYQRLIDLNGEKDGAEMLSEIEDRFGHPPEDVFILIDLMVFRSLLRQAAIVRAGYRNGVLSVRFHSELKFDVDKLLKMVKGSSGALRLSPAGVLSMDIGEEVETPRVLYGKLKELLGSIGLLAESSSAREN